MDCPNPTEMESLPLTISLNCAQEALLCIIIAELDKNFTPLAQCHLQVGEKGKLK
jgi:hypothetical protein